MRRILAVATIVLCSFAAIAQQSNNHAVVPRLVRFTGAITNADGTPRTGVAGVMFSLYAEQQGGSALWTELQNVTLDASGQYSVLLGSQHAEGVPAELFTSNEARWMGIQVEAEPEQPRILLVSVPYALKAGDAETVGGHAVSDFVLTPAAAAVASSGTSTTSSSAKTSTSSAGVTTFALNTGSSAGTTNFIAKWTPDGSTLGNALLYDSGTAIGLGTTTPLALLEVDDTNAGGGLLLKGPSGDTANLRFRDPGASPSDFNIDYAGGALRYFSETGTNSGGVLRMVINSTTGNVGIGTSSSTPGTKLEVNGSIRMLSPAGTTFDANSAGFMFFAGTSDYKIGFDSKAGTVGYIRYNVDVPDAIHGHIFSAGPAGSQGDLMLIRGDGNVGIGTSTPTQKLTVAGAIQSTSGGFMFPDGSSLASGNNPSGSNATQVFHVTQNGTGPTTLTVATLPAAIRGDSTSTTPNAGSPNYTSGVLGTSASSYGFGVVGENLANSVSTNDYAIGVFGVSTQSTIGTGVWGEAEASSGTTVGVYGKSFSSGTTNTTGGTGVFGFASATTGDAVGVYGRSDSTGGTGVWGDVTATTGTTFGVYGSVASASGTAAVFDNTASGYILVGRATTNRNNVFRVDGTGKGFFNGGTQQGGADFAESVEVLGSNENYHPGEVLVIDPTGTRRLALSSRPYSTLVAGIYSTKPGILATTHMMDDPRITEAEVPLAVVGIVPCKVTTENGPIQAGDLLVTSSIPGYAMKGTDRGRMLGAVIGKAMQSIKEGTGVIEVLVSLN